MAGFWKFNTFMGVLGVLLMLGGIYGTQHTVNFDPNNVFSFSASFDLHSRDVPSITFVVGFSFVLYEFLMTGLGFLVGFFGAQLTSRR